ncbi:MAG: hypothetical protein ISQ32_00415 [Rickettsiales bacterium]|nr:hypothetical protein [Rickettsiales bacterium]
MKNLKCVSYVTIALCLGVNHGFANTEQRIKNLEQEISDLKKLYSQNFAEDSADSNSRRKIYDNKFNPSIGVVLNGEYAIYSEDEAEFSGFAVGEEGERGDEGFSIGETELNFSSNIDDKFYGSVTAAIVYEDGSNIVELEEAYVKTTPGLGLPSGLSIKAGRALWTLGYLNEHHAHSDNFTDRPLPYRAYLNKGFNDDGAQISYLLPTDIYQEIGAGSFTGNDFPFAEGDGKGNYSLFYRIGSDIGQNHNWRLGFSTLKGEAKGNRTTNEDTVTFTGESDLYIADLKYNFAPSGNAKNQLITLQAEYFKREEDGTYNDTNASTGDVDVDNDSSGWYGQIVYKFKPQWRVGVRYSELESADTPAGLSSSFLNADGFNPTSISTMVDWTNSEYSRFRIQFNDNELSDGNTDEQYIFQYIVSFGAHTAHKF